MICSPNPQGPHLYRSNSTHTSVCTFFSWAKSASYLAKNEETEAQALSKVKTGDTETGIFPEDHQLKARRVTAQTQTGRRLRVAANELGQIAVVRSCK